MNTSSTKPWEHRRWRGGVVRGNNTWVPGVVFLVVGGALSAVTTVITTVVGGERILHEGWITISFVLSFMMVGICFLVGALISLSRWWRFGKTRVRMTTVPGVIGGRFSGEVELPDSFPADADVYLELLCGVTRSAPARGNDDSGSTSVSKVWSQKICTKPGDRHCRNRQWRIPFDFAIPYKTKREEPLPDVMPDETDNGTVEGGISVNYGWHLCVTSTLPGADLDIKFRVPVFKTEASNRTLEHVPEAGADLPLEQYLAMKDEKRRVRVEAGPRGPVFVGMVRPVMWSTVLVLAFFGVGFIAAGIGIPISVLTTSGLAKNLHVPKDWLDALGLLPSLAFIILPCIMGLVCFTFGAFISMFTVGSVVSRRTWVERGRICQTRTFLGLPLPSCSVPCDSVERVDTNASSIGVYFKQKNAGKSFPARWVC